MDKKKFLEGLTGMSTKEYLQLLISEYKRDIELDHNTNRDKTNEETKNEKHMSDI